MNAPAFLQPQFKVLYHLDVISLHDPLVKKLLAVMWDAPSPEELGLAIHQGSIEVYGTGRGLILLEMVDWAKGRELSIYGMVGRDILTRWREVLEDLKALARYKGCSMIGGVGVPKAWQRFGPRAGFKPVSTHYLMELEDGR